MGTKWTDAQIKSICNDYINDMPNDEMVIKYGVPWIEIKYVINRMKVRRTKRAKKRIDISDEDLTELFDEYRKGAYVDELSEKYNLSRQQIYNFVKRNNVKREVYRYNGFKKHFCDVGNPETVEKIRAMQKKGLKNPQIAKNLDISLDMYRRLVNLHPELRRKGKFNLAKNYPEENPEDEKFCHDYAIDCVNYKHAYCTFCDCTIFRDKQGYRDVCPHYKHDYRKNIKI